MGILWQLFDTPKKDNQKQLGWDFFYPTCLLGVFFQRSSFFLEEFGSGTIS